MFPFNFIQQLIGFHLLLSQKKTFVSNRLTFVIWKKNMVFSPPSISYLGTSPALRWWRWRRHQSWRRYHTGANRANGCQRWSFSLQRWFIRKCGGPWKPGGLSISRSCCSFLRNAHTAIQSAKGFHWRHATFTRRRYVSSHQTYFKLSNRESLNLTHEKLNKIMN